MLLLFKMHLLELIDVRPNKAIKLSFAINSSI